MEKTIHTKVQVTPWRTMVEWLGLYLSNKNEWTLPTQRRDTAWQLRQHVYMKPHWWTPRPPLKHGSCIGKAGKKRPCKSVCKSPSGLLLYTAILQQVWHVMGVSLCLKIFPGAAQHETGKSWCTKYLQGQDPKSLLSNGMACQIVWISIVSMASLANKMFGSRLEVHLIPFSSLWFLEFHVYLVYFSTTGTFKQRKRTNQTWTKLIVNRACAFSMFTPEPIVTICL